MENQRHSGLLLHISSLPGCYGIGDFGSSAYNFVDYLCATNQSCWQILPLNPVDAIFGNSPYSSPSAFALNPLFISPEKLVTDKHLNQKDIETSKIFSDEKVNYDVVSKYKTKLLKTVLENNDGQWDGFNQFVADNAYWLNDYACFTVLKNQNESIWTNWNDEWKNDTDIFRKKMEDKYKVEIEQVQKIQYLLHGQWIALKKYANETGIKIIGDIPIYVNTDSADVWSSKSIFKLDENNQPQVVSGVPPDYFSETGQRWGNPVYDWQVLKEEGYQWWINRFKRNFDLYDTVRIDHFRGLINYWEIPAQERTGIKGQWKDVPTTDFFSVLKENFGDLPIIAEDLGMISDDVRERIDACGFPCMKILLFAFGGDLQSHPYLPHNYPESCVVYPGTHDNNTVVGWFNTEATNDEKSKFDQYADKNVKQKELHWKFIELALNSKAQRALIAVQDVLGLNEKSRMNKPATLEGNWEWRLSSIKDLLSTTTQLRDMTSESQRSIS